jgi:hypothetical protein
MFLVPHNVDLFEKAYQDLRRRLSWRILYAFTEPRPSEEEGDVHNYFAYDPDFEFERPRTEKIPDLPRYINFGFDKGAEYIRKRMEDIRHTPLDPKLATFSEFKPKVGEIRKFLADRNYVVTGTDKNLGLAVSELGWVIAKCLDLLSDEKSYTKIKESHARETCEYHCKSMEELAVLADDCHSKQLAGFLRSNITPQQDRRRTGRFQHEIVYDIHKVPFFYGIPKIHKTPTKMRPIIPCHSAIQNPAAAYITKSLKPLVKAAPTIIHGTKDLAIKLSKVRMVNRKKQKLYIVTGDVVAYYPNIDLDKCLKLVKEMYMEYKGYTNETIELLDEQDRKLFELFCGCLEHGNRILICQFFENFYMQRQGLAMGVSCSPSLANLFGYFFEKTCGILTDPDVIFYGRYIDDCLALVWATSETDAISKCSIVKIDTCQIEWQASRSHQPFLDMLLYIDSDGSLQHMPYRKAGNHMERIPFVSNHPEDVKRGAIIGEISRMAVLSSTFDNYKTALDGLFVLYVRRGYPEAWLEPIFKREAQKRYNQRLGETSEDLTVPGKPDSEEVIVLKSEFNTAWDFFSAKELGNIVHDSWRTYLEGAEKGEYPISPMLGRELGDLASTDVDLMTELQDSGGIGTGWTIDWRKYSLPDIRKLTFGSSARWIVSRRRTIQLKDMVSTWKRTMINQFYLGTEATPWVPGVWPHAGGRSETLDAWVIAKGFNERDERLREQRVAPEVIESFERLDNLELQRQLVRFPVQQPVVTGRKSPIQTGVVSDDEDPLPAKYRRLRVFRE